MAVKYVKDFSFPSSGGFHGDVQRFAKGGHVTKVPAKAKASAKDVPARAKPNAPARGAPKMKSEPAKGKRQGYNEGGRVPGYDMDRLPAKKPPGRTMDLARSKPFKGAYEGYADGGEVYTGPPIPLVDDRGNPITYRPDDERPPPLPFENPPLETDEPGYKGRFDVASSAPFKNPPLETKRNAYRPSEPLTYRWSDGTYNYLPEETGKRTPLGALSSSLRAKDARSQEPVYARDVETRLDRGVRPGQMARQQRVEDRVNAARQALFEDKAPTYLRPPMEEPRYLVPEMPDYGREYAMPVPGPGAGGVAQPGMAMIAPPALGRFAKGGKVQKVMREYKEGKLHSGSKKGPLVKNREQAVAIALSEARKAGAKIPKKAEGGIFNDESMAYQSKGPKTRYTPAKGRRMARERAMERRALDKARHAEKYAPGLSLDMPDRKKHGGMMKGKKFPDLTGDGKVTRADVLKGRGVIKDRKMPTHNRKPMYGKG